MDLLREKLRCTPMGAVLRKGGSSSSSETTTTNQDNRVAVQDGLGVSGSDGNVVSVNSTDAIQAIAQLGAEVIAQTGEAVVQLNKDTTAAQVTSWDATVAAGAHLVDKLIDGATKSYTVAEKAIDSFQPAENKTQDTSLKLGMIAAAGIAATILLSKTK